MNIKSLTTPQRGLCVLCAAGLVAIVVWTEKVCFVQNSVMQCSSNSNLAPQYDANAIVVRGLLTLIVTGLLLVTLQRRGD